MLTEHVAAMRADDPAGRHDAAMPVGTGVSLPAAEPVGVVGGRPAPAPAAAGLETSSPGDVSTAAEGSSTRFAPDAFAALGPGDAAMVKFVADYLHLLDGRLDTIRRCLEDSDIEGARVAVLSLESSSVMIGGEPLAARLTELRSQLDLGTTPQRNALMALVDTAAAAFRSELESRR